MLHRTVKSENFQDSQDGDNKDQKPMVLDGSIAFNVQSKCEAVKSEEINIRLTARIVVR